MRFVDAQKSRHTASGRLSRSPVSAADRTEAAASSLLDHDLQADAGNCLGLALAHGRESRDVIAFLTAPRQEAGPGHVVLSDVATGAVREPGGTAQVAAAVEAYAAATGRRLLALALPKQIRAIVALPLALRGRAVGEAGFPLADIAGMTFGIGPNAAPPSAPRETTSSPAPSQAATGTASEWLDSLGIAVSTGGQGAFAKAASEIRALLDGPAASESQAPFSGASGEQASGTAFDPLTEAFAALDDPIDKSDPWPGASAANGYAGAVDRRDMPGDSTPASIRDPSDTPASPTDQQSGASDQPPVPDPPTGFVPRYAVLGGMAGRPGSWGLWSGASSPAGEAPAQSLETRANVPAEPASAHLDDPDSLHASTGNEAARETPLENAHAQSTSRPAASMPRGETGARAGARASGTDKPAEGAQQVHQTQHERQRGLPAPDERAALAGSDFRAEDDGSGRDPTARQASHFSIAEALQQNPGAPRQPPKTGDDAPRHLAQGRLAPECLAPECLALQHSGDPARHTGQKGAVGKKGGKPLGEGTSGPSDPTAPAQARHASAEAAGVKLPLEVSGDGAVDEGGGRGTRRAARPSPNTLASGLGPGRPDAHSPAETSRARQTAGQRPAESVSINIEDPVRHSLAESMRQRLFRNIGKVSFSATIASCAIWTMFDLGPVADIVCRAATLLFGILTLFRAMRSARNHFGDDTLP